MPQASSQAITVTKFAIPEIIFGQNSIGHLAHCARRLGARKVLLVTDPGLEKAGWVETILKALDADGISWAYFSDVTSNPRDSQVRDGVRLYEEAHADVIIALGGGSPMDAAKGIATLVGNGGSISDYEGANRIMRPLPPMLFVPSTAGSGSDISQFCIITDVTRQVKMSIISRSLVPNVSIIDPNLLSTKPEELIIASAVDALAHAVESYTSNLASPFTEIQALRAIELIMKHLKPAVRTRSLDDLTQLSIASTAAGMSFSNAGLGFAHALAHSLGGLFDVLHGLVHPILLPAVMRYNMPACVHKMATIGKLVLGPRICSDAEMAKQGIDHIQAFFQELGVPVRLRELLPDQSVLHRMCAAAVNDACMLTNPRQGDCEALVSVCEEAW